MRKINSISNTGDTLRRFLKKQFKAQKLTYRELAQRLGVAEVTVKRWMTSRDMGFEVFAEISRILGVSPVSLIEAGLSQETAHPYTLAQEEYFATHPRQWLLFIKTIYGCPAEEAREVAGLSRSAFLKSLKEMEALGLLRLYPNDRVRALIKGPFTANPDGPIMRAFVAKIHDCLYRHFRKFRYLRERPEHLSCSYYRPFEMYLDDQTAKEFSLELSTVLLKYRAISHTQYDKWNKVKPVSGLIAVDQFDSWRRVLCEDNS